MKLTMFGGFVVEGDAEELASYTVIVTRLFKGLQDADEQKEIEGMITDLCKTKRPGPGDDAT